MPNNPQPPQVISDDSGAENQEADNPNNPENDEADNPNATTVVGCATTVSALLRLLSNYTATRLIVMIVDSPMEN